MTHLELRNFTRYQHYRDRRPPWVKFYVDFLDDEELTPLSPTTRLVAALLPLIASVKGNRMPDSAPWLAAECSITVRAATEAIRDLVTCCYLVRVSDPASESASDPASESASDPASESASARARPRPRGEGEGEGEGETKSSKGSSVPSHANGAASEETNYAIERLISACTDRDVHTENVLRSFARQLQPAAFYRAHEALNGRRRDGRTAYAVGALKSMLSEGQYLRGGLDTDSASGTL